MRDGKSGWTAGRGSRLVAFAAAAASSLALCSSAQATVTVGSQLTADFHPLAYCIPICTTAPLTLVEPGAHAVSPVDGVVVRWRVFQASGSAFKLRVLRPAGGTLYTGAGTSAAETPSGEGVQTFATHLPIEAGDLIGLDATSASAKLGWASVAGGQMGFWSQPADGSSEEVRTPGENEEAAFNADVQARPAVTAITPPTGPLEGGAGVSIVGTDFPGASSVSFGGVPALGFSVDSESRITAIAPPRSVPGSVHVSVTTFVGTSLPANSARYTYEAAYASKARQPRCVVPRLRGKSLRVARRKLRRAHCRLGKVAHTKRRRPARRSRRRIVAQHPAPEKVRPRGTKVRVKLSWVSRRAASKRRGS